jgi:hypothetical protein
VQCGGSDLGVEQLEIAVNQREFARISASTVPASSRAPPTVSLRNTAAMRPPSDDDPGENNADASFATIRPFHCLGAAPVSQIPQHSTVRKGTTRGGT